MAKKRVFMPAACILNAFNDSPIGEKGGEGERKIADRLMSVKRKSEDSFRAQTYVIA
jgi:hypothetical protein